jgi:U3 small nucleolar RNA-associated protein 25
MFVPFDCANPKDEPEKRFAYFTTQVISATPTLTSLILHHVKLLPRVLKSAVQSANTVIFIPSSFDFIRVHNYFRKQSSLSFAILSEWAPHKKQNPKMLANYM